MEEDLTFATPGSLPIKRNYNGYPLQPRTQGYQHHQPPNHGYQHYQHHQPPNQGYQYYQPQNQGYQHHQSQEQGYQPPTRQAASWMTPEIRTELQMRNKLKETSQRSTEDKKAYQAQCEKVQQMIDESKASVGIPTVSTSPYPSVSRTPRMNHNMNSQQESGSFDSTTTHHNQNTASFDPNTAYRHSQNPASYYNHDSQASHNVHTCGPCNRSYFSKYKLEEHLKEHVECPFPECKLSAHIKVIDQHINNQHMLVNFANLQIDDETWIAERKKRFPTVRRAELRRAEQLEKIKRGEKLGKSNKPFNNNRISSGKPQRGKNWEQNTTRKEINNRSVNVKESGDGNTRNNSLQATQQKYQSENSGIQQTRKEKGVQNTPEERGGAAGRGRFRHNWRRGERPAYPPRAHLDVDMFESSDDEDKPPSFKGTRHFYESTGEVSYFSISSNKLDTEDAHQDMEAESEKTNNICISDEEEWPAAESLEEHNNSSGGLVLGGALGSLMGAYSDSEEEEETTPVPVRKQQDKPYLPAPANGITSIANSACVPDSQTTTATVKEKDKEEISKPGPSEGSNNTERPAWKHRNRRRQRPQRNQDTKEKEKKPVVPVFKRFRRRRKTLLEKLLMPDIIHERNVMLQCVKFIVENNFFDGGQSDSVQEEKSDVLQQEEVQTVTDDGVERNNLEQQGETGTVTDGDVEREQDGQQQRQNETLACDKLKKDLVQEDEMIETDAGGSKARKNTTHQEQMEIVSRDEEKTVANVEEVTERKVESLANGREERRDGAQQDVLKTVVSDEEVSKMMEKDSNEMEKVNDDSKVTKIITKDNKIAERDDEEKRDVIEQEKVMETVPNDGEVIEKVEIEVEKIIDGDKVPEMRVKEVEQANDNGECSR
ncbi:hypothetical protein Pcinc_036618 [Petrolisthes cinctipes]|uniref:C2H2-type domain-containing protein n=1 Tax=Petrolisthes cinctipes TaxID=88211 RepID=A0AAE1BU82_PETCI|nr:hypothetical protein Pcinc_036618 [Petrolisthes cinctipes]